MNERIRLMAKANQAFTESRVTEPEVRKFMQLIVKECVNVVEGGRFLHDDAPTAIFARECSSAIKRHFGIEE